MEKKSSWTCTFVVQVVICAALYLALNLGHPQDSIYKNNNGIFSPVRDFYFITVRGGCRSLQDQIHLLKIIENVAEVYNARFVVNISELEEDDPLAQNASRISPLLNVSWYNTRSSKGQKVGSFLKQFNISYGNILNVIGIDASSLLDVVLAESMTGSGNYMSYRLTEMLEATTSNWIIVFGYNPVAVCDENVEQIEAKLVSEPLHHTFTKYGVNAYLSRGSCTYAPRGGVAYIGIPDIASLNSSQGYQKRMADVFLLHRVNSLEIVTYFVSSAGEIVNQVAIQQRGKEFM